MGDMNAEAMEVREMKEKLRIAIEALQFISKCYGGSAPFIAAEARVALFKMKIPVDHQEQVP